MSEIIFHINEGRFEGVYTDDKTLKITVIDQDDESLDPYIITRAEADPLSYGRKIVDEVESAK